MTGRAATTLIAAAAAAVLAGCGSSSMEASRPAGTATAREASGGGATVTMGDYFYRPETLTVTVGTPVTFRNDGRIPHTVADVDAAGEVRSRLIRPRPLDTGDTQRVVFRRPGTVRYLCTFHPTLMSGRIVVRPAG